MITLQELSYGYRGQPPLGTFSGHFASGSMTAVVGANGCGKSTLLKTLAGLLPPLSGRCYVDHAGESTPGYLPQLSEFDRQFPLSVQDLVLMGCFVHSGMLGRISADWRRHADDALETTGMRHCARRPIGELSGGQLQRVLFARLLVMQSPVLLLDEPFTGIDQQTTAVLLEVITRLNRQGRTILAVLHDIHMVQQYFPQVLHLHADGPRLERGKNLADAPSPEPSELFHDAISLVK
ncbi:ABC transporter ATP-binding protein [Affinibrenneria salicis]|uniref:ABC transporter ATP-binding protein n=1 Tax=Affinibrenneria salicis TaxID=2590031 RepID=A0A5J5G5X2_9GAMM|nr:ABC transporter ATP-binding protein [Affinibrenneria salicis]KAA9002567.1 ABC transporter ATP-binding protein [Affinibrenneria salicis]KAA9003145.1 ABC transporter ATP-binding protein [Affinibrenneria salicis]